MQAYKNAHGNWEVESKIEIENGYTLKVVTCKRSSGDLVTVATSVKEENGFYVYRMYTDFSSRIAVSRPGRITKGAVEKQHDEVMANIQQTVDAATNIRKPLHNH